MPYLAGKSAFSAGQFGLQLDGAKVSAYIKSVEGGFLKASVTDEAIGAHAYHVKHLSTREIDPFSVELGLSGSRNVLSWIQESWNKKFSRRSGQVAHADFDMKGKYEHDFMDALIMETAFPTLDAMSREPGYLKIKFLPELVQTKQVATSRILADIAPQQKMWSNSAFRMSLAGLDMSQVAKIDAFTIKQGVKALHVGSARLPEIEPTKIEFPELAVYMALEYAQPVIDWFDAAVKDGGTSDKVEKHGAIEFLTPDRNQTIFQIRLFEVGIKGWSIVRSEARQDAVKRAKFDLFVGRMELEPGSGMA
jgi:hypothetical protein